MAGFKKLDMMGDNAFAKGFLSKSFGNAVIKRVNRNLKVVFPEAMGISLEWIESDEDVTLVIKSDWRPREVTDCDGVTFEVLARKVVEP